MRNIPFSPPDMSELEISNVTKVLNSGWLTTGPNTKQFEKEIAEFCHTERAVCLNSATACMESTLRLLGIGPGDEVITSAYTYTASASVIDHVGAKIVLVDTKPNSFEMDYNKLENAITEKTKAVIAVDLAGIMCDYEKIYASVDNRKKIFKPNNKIQELYNRVIIIADAAHSFGAFQKGKMSGEVADFTCFSFHAVKNLTTVEGGAVTWIKKEGIDNEEIYNEYMLLSLHGQSKDALAKSTLGAWEYDIKILGYKSNMTDIQAAIGLAQLERYHHLLNRRKEIINFYNNKLDDKFINYLPHYSEQYNSSGHLYMINLIGKNINQRNEFIMNMAEKGISCNVHYKPLPMFTAYRNLGFKIDDYPNAYQLFSNEVTLPLHTLLSQDELDYVIKFANKYAE